MVRLTAKDFTGSSPIIGVPTLTVRTRKELIAAFQQDPPPKRIVVEFESRTLRWVLVALLGFKGIAVVDGLIRTAMEKGYGVKTDWNAEIMGKKISGRVVFTPPPPKRPVPKTGEE